MKRPILLFIFSVSLAGCVTETREVGDAAGSFEIRISTPD